MFQVRRFVSLKKLALFMFFSTFSIYILHIVDVKYGNTLKIPAAQSSVSVKSAETSNVNVNEEDEDKLLKIPGKCYTNCCAYSKIQIIKNCSKVENREPCRIAYGMGNGALSFRHSSEPYKSCETSLKENLSLAKSQPVQNHRKRIQACLGSNSCISANSAVFLHVCREFAQEEHGYASDKYHSFTGEQRKQRVKKAVREFSSLKQTVSFVGSFKEFGRVPTQRVIEDAVRVSMENLKKQHLPLTEIYVLASLSCSAASISALPFHLDLLPLATRPSLNIDELERMAREAMKESSRKIMNKFDGLVAITYSNGPNVGLDLLLESAQLHGITLKILGWGERNPSPAQKLRACLEFLKEVEPHIVVIFLDAFDAFFVSDAREILERFFIMKSNVVFGAENACYPLMYPYFNFGYEFCEDETYFSKKTSKLNRTRYINTGQWIGYATSALDLLVDYLKLVGEDHAEIFPGTDQFALELMRISGAWNIALDYDAYIFMVGLSYSDEQVAHMNTTVMHFNGQKPRAYMWAKRHLEENCPHQSQNFPLSSRATFEIYRSCDSK